MDHGPQTPCDVIALAGGYPGGREGRISGTDGTTGPRATPCRLKHGARSLPSPVLHGHPEKLSKAEVHEINDLLTLNLDIGQFARDAIVNAEGPELSALLDAIAAEFPRNRTRRSNRASRFRTPPAVPARSLRRPRILETVDSDCLERMERLSRKWMQEVGTGSRRVHEQDVDGHRTHMH